MKLKPEDLEKISDRMKARKVEALEAATPDAIVAGNIGCMVQIASGTEVPVVHTVELLDWVTGGPEPRVMAGVLRGVAKTLVAAE